MNKKDEIVQYIIVNMDLKMGKGKLAAQVAHGAVKGFYRGFIHFGYKYNSWAYDWVNSSHTKIVLKSNFDEMAILMNVTEIYKLFFSIVDEGRTQIEESSLTVLASVPMPKSEFPEEIKNLKLL